VRVYVKNGGYYDIAAYGENAAGLRRFLVVTAPSAGGKYLSEKFKEFMKEARVEVRLSDIWLTEKGRVAADLTLSEAGIDVKYNVYLSDRIELEFQSTDRSRVELAARLLKLAGVGVVVRKVEVGGRDVWYIKAATDMLAAGREELRNVLAKVVRKAIARGWVDAGKAEGWLEELKRGRVPKEG